MHYDDFNKMLEKMHSEELALGATKGREYTKGDRLDNFKRLSLELGISPKQVLWVYLKKHLDSIANYIRLDAARKPNEMPMLRETLSEPIEGRISDARVYLSLLRGLIEEEKKT